jgi:hypothetical protein
MANEENAEVSQVEGAYMRASAGVVRAVGPHVYLLSPQQPLQLILFDRGLINIKRLYFIIILIIVTVSGL